MGTRLPEVLQSQERSQSWLARKTAKSTAYVTRVIDGSRRPSEDFKARSAAALGVPVDLLFPEERKAA